MNALGLILLVFAFVFFCISAFVKEIDKAKFIAIGLACWSLSEILGGAAKVLGWH